MKENIEKMRNIQYLNYWKKYNYTKPVVKTTKKDKYSFSKQSKYTDIISSDKYIPQINR